MDSLTIPPGCNGPRLSGNGGYVGGALAAAFTSKFGGDGTVEITLRAPVPIDRALQLVPDNKNGGEALMLRDGATLVCEARAGSLAHLKPPPAPTDWAEVMRRGRHGGSPVESDYGHCIVCGRGRAVGDGLRVWGTSGPQPGYSLSCYIPHANHADDSGRIRPEFVWARSTARAPMPRRMTAISARR